LFAVGRYAVTKGIHLNKIGVEAKPNGKLIVSDTEQTTCENVYAIGDVIFGKLELTPVAISCVKLRSVHGGMMPPPQSLRIAA